MPFLLLSMMGCCYKIGDDCSFSRFLIRVLEDLSMGRSVVFGSMEVNLFYLSLVSIFIEIPSRPRYFRILLLFDARISFNSVRLLSKVCPLNNDTILVFPPPVFVNYLWIFFLSIKKLSSIKGVLPYYPRQDGEGELSYRYLSFLLLPFSLPKGPPPAKLY